MQESL